MRDLVGRPEQVRRASRSCGPRSAIRAAPATGEVERPVGVLGGQRLQRRQLLGHPLRRRPPAGLARGQRARHRQHRPDLGGQPLVDAGQLVVVELVELEAGLLAEGDHRAGDLVRRAERHALADQPLGDVGGQREALRRRGLEHLRAAASASRSCR